jgi:hypothetical protein
VHLPRIRASGVKEFEGCHSGLNFQIHTVSQVILYMNSQREKSGVVNT